MKKSFKKSDFKQVHEFMSSYNDPFYIEDILKDDKLDINMKSLFIINECGLSIVELKKFVLGYSKLMPQDKFLSEAIHSSELYIDERITLKELQKAPTSMLQSIFSSGMNFDSLPKLPMLLYNIHNEDQMFHAYIHLISSGCSHYLQWNDSDKVMKYLADFTSEN